MYKFIFLKSEDSTQIEFEGALICARDSISSTLAEDFWDAKIHENSITISAVATESASASLDFLDIKQKILGCFCDDAGRLYPEFSRIEAINPAPDL
jgi:hypothetical protein